MAIKPQDWHEKARGLACSIPALTYNQIGEACGVSGNQVRHFYTEAGIVKTIPVVKPTERQRAWYQKKGSGLGWTDYNRSKK